jgi:uncharacterized protein (DUF58 family)
MLDRFFRAVILFFATCLLITSGRAASFTATLDRDTITLGEQATLSLTFEGGQPAKLTPLEVPGLQFGTPSRSFSQNIDFNSGQVNARLVLSFPVTPQREGEFTIPAMTADVGGQAMASQPLKLTVTKPAQRLPAEPIPIRNSPLRGWRCRRRRFIPAKLSPPTYNFFTGRTRNWRTSRKSPARPRMDSPSGRLPVAI